MTSIKMDIVETEIAESYSSSLEDLTSSSKPLINMLTLLAEENIGHSKTISNAILHRLDKVESHFKLPILYLIDSIVKNIGGVYKTQFSQAIADVFIGAYDTVNDGIRKKMLHLRQTWNDIFPLTELQKIDITLNRQWPIYPGYVVQSSAPIVDLKYKLEQELLQLKIKKLELDLAAKQKLLTQGSSAISSHIPNANIPATVQIQNYINSTNCDQQINHTIPQNIQASTLELPAHGTNVNNLFGMNDVDLRVMPSIQHPPPQTHQNFQEHKSNDRVPNKRRRLDNSNQMFESKAVTESTVGNFVTKERRKIRSRWENQNKAETSIAITQDNVSTMARKRTDIRAQTNVPSSFSPLMVVDNVNAKPSSVIISKNNLNIGNKRLKTIENVKNSKHSSEKHVDRKLIKVLLSQPKTLKQRETTIVNTLYSGEQCSSCGIRFPKHETTKYGQHLDWHYRKNRRDRNSQKRTHSRDWFYGIADWLQFEEIENLDEREKNWFEMQQNNNIDLLNDDSDQGSSLTAEQPSCIAGPNDHDKICDVCHDPFEMFYHEDSEEWHLRNAVRVDECIYHPICFEDYQNSALESQNLQSNAIKEENSCDSFSKNDRIPALDAAPAATADADDDDDDDDVILLPCAETTIMEILDDNDKSEASSSEQNASATQDSTSMQMTMNKEDRSKTRETEIQILEPHIPMMDLDLYDESEATNKSIPVVKIKEEPMDDEYAYDSFEDVGTIEAHPIESSYVESVDESTSSMLNSQPKILSTIDGNFELQGVSRSAFGTNKIKINISKNVQLNKNNSSESINDHLTINDDESRLSNDSSNDSTINKNRTSHIEALINIDEEIVSDDIIDYEIKDSMKGIKFNEVPIQRKGVEASGLCSIM